MMKEKGKGAGIMVSNFIDEHNRFLVLSDEEYNAAKVTNPNIRPYAQEFRSMMKARRGIGHGTSSFLKCSEQL